MIYETLKKLCKDRGISINKLENTLGISRGSLCKIDTNKPSSDKLQKLADYFGISVDYLLSGGEVGEKYYINEETAAVAQEIFESRELRALFDVQRDMSPEDLKALHNMALALKRKERGYIDDTGC